MFPIEREQDLLFLVVIDLVGVMLSCVQDISQIGRQIGTKLAYS